MTKTIHHLGTGYGPHVDEIDGKLIYSLPVESSFVTLSFSFEINEKDLEVLKSDSSRDATLYVVLHTLLQNTFGPHFANAKKLPDPFTQEQFREVASIVLHAPKTKLKKFIEKFGLDHNMSVQFYIDQHLKTKN